MVSRRIQLALISVLITPVLLASCSSGTQVASGGSGHLAGIIFVEDGPGRACRVDSPSTCNAGTDAGTFDLVGNNSRQVTAGHMGTFTIAVPAGTYAVAPTKAESDVPGGMRCSSQPGSIVIQPHRLTHVIVHCWGSMA